MFEFSSIETVPTSARSIDMKQVDGFADEITIGMSSLDLCDKKEYEKEISGCMLPATNPDQRCLYE